MLAELRRYVSILFLAKKALSQVAFVTDITSNSLSTISDKSIMGILKSV